MTRSTLFTGKTAVVIGASMAGLLAARALADHYEQVTLLERDTFPTPGAYRRGVPQARHAHAVLVRGLEIMEGYFSGLTAELGGQGANVGDISGKVRWYHGGGFHRPCVSGHNGIGVSRPVLEAAVRKRVLALPNVDVVTACDVLGLQATSDKSRITGVRVIRRHPGSAEEMLTADLVVDASGRGSRSPAWLEALGYARPAEEAVQIGVTYVSCVYHRHPAQLPGINAVVVSADPASPYVGVLMGQEGDRWMLTVAAYLGDEPPTNHAGLRDFVRRLPTPLIYDVIRDAEPLSEPVKHKIPSSLRRRYERLHRFPAGYLVIGDALCSFNPIYGQGMSVAALEAVTLAECVAQGEAQLARRFFGRISQIVDVPWSTAVGNDLRFPAVQGPRSLLTRFINWYVDKLHHAARYDATVSVAFLKVINLLAPPSSILQPRIAWRVLRGNVRREVGPAQLDRENSSASISTMQSG